MRGSLAVAAWDGQSRIPPADRVPVIPQFAIPGTALVLRLAEVVTLLAK
ncbi:MAG TPA: hypothetical protein VML19_04120 [Verrucomicrobiae bacterium]|nr:hypothetical protein [Verrucomicrobiae bacterium]